jgi:hypothetical protein
MRERTPRYHNNTYRDSIQVQKLVRKLCRRHFNKCKLAADSNAEDGRLMCFAQIDPPHRGAQEMQQEQFGCARRRIPDE